MLRNLDTFMSSRAVRIFYGIVMPGLVLIGFMVVSSLMKRPTLSGSPIIDVLARIVVSLWLAIGYYRLPDLAKKYRVYPNIEWKKSDISPAGRVLYVAMTLWLAFGAGLVMWWAINLFLPNLKDISLLLGILSGMVYGIPLAIQYQVFKI